MDSQNTNPLEGGLESSQFENEETQPQVGDVFNSQSGESLETPDESTSLVNKAKETKFAEYVIPDKMSRLKFALYSLPMVLVAIGLIIFIIVKINSPQDAQSNKLIETKEQDINIQQFQEATSDSFVSAKDQKVTINGELLVNGALVIPSAQEPANPITGQIYFDQSSSEVKYYDGKTFISLANNSAQICYIGADCGFLKTGDINVSALSLPQDLAVSASPTFAALNLTSNLSVSSGGTGQSSFTNNVVLLGNGSSAIKVSNTPSAGQVFVGNASGTPTFVSISGDLTLSASGVADLALNSVGANELQASGVTGGSYGDSSNIPVVTVDADGRITSISTVSIAGGGGDILQGGNSFGANITLGSNDNYSLNFETNGTTRLTVESDGDVAFDTNTLFVDATTNRVGVGTITPGSTLQINQPDDSTIAQILRRNSGTAVNLLELQNESGTSISVITSSGRFRASNLSGGDPNYGFMNDIDTGLKYIGANEFALTTGGTDRLTVDGSGTATFTGLVTANGNLTVQAGDIFTMNGDAFTDLTGTGLEISSGSLQVDVDGTSITLNGNQVQTALGTSIDTSEITNGTILFADLSQNGCSGNDIIKWNGSAWACATDDVGTGDGGITTLNGQTGLTQTFANDTNVTISSSGDVHTLGWSGQLSVARGGTGANTAQGAINAISGLTTNGDLLYHNGTNSTALARGSNGQCLTSNATTILWGSCAGSGTTFFTLAGTSGTPQSINGGDTVTIAAGSNISTTAGATDTVTIDVVSNPTFTGLVTASNGLTVSSSGASITGGLNNNSGGITNAGAVSGATTVTASGNINTTAGVLQLNGTDINTAGTLTNVAYENQSNVFTQSNAFQANLVNTEGGYFATQRISADISTTGTLNDLDFGTGSLVRFSGASTQTVTGLANGADGRILTIINAAAQAMNINNEDGGSTAANRIVTGTGGNISVASGSSLTLIYDSSDSRWRVIGDVAGGAGTGANQALSNLSGVNLNTALNVNSGNLELQTTTSGDILLTPASSTGLANVLNGNLKVGNGTPDVSLNGEDLYVEGTLEVDGASRFDGNLNIGANILQGTTAIIDFSNFDVDASGNISTTGTISSGLINGQTISSGANFTGTLAVQGATITVGTADVGGTDGKIVLLNNSNSNTVTIQTDDAPASGSIIYRFEDPGWTGTYNICTTASVCTGYQASGSYFAQNGNSFGTDALLGTLDGNNLQFITNGANVRFLIDTTGAGIFNPSLNDSDFIVRGDNDSNLFYTDASTDRVGIGTNTPGYKLHVKQDSATAEVRLESDTSANISLQKTGTGAEVWSLSAASDGFRLTQGATTRLFYTGGKLSVSTSNLGYDLGVSGTLGSTGNATIEGGTATLGTTSQAGSLILYDGTSNTGTIQPTALASNRVYTLPDEDGTICTTGSVCSGYASSASAFIQNGNSFTANATLGTNDVYDLNLETSGLTRLTVQADGDVAFDTDTLFVDASANKVSVGDSTPSGNGTKLVVTENATEAFSDFDSMAYFSRDVTPGASGAGDTYLSAWYRLFVKDSANSPGQVIGQNNQIIHEGTQSVTDAYGSQSTVRLENTGDITNGYAFVSTFQLVDNAGSNIQNGVGFYASTPSATVGSITNMYGLQVKNQANTYVTTAYGGLIEAQTGAISASYGLAIQAADTQTLWISQNADNTTASAGIAFGSSRDTNLYRSAADTLKTDGNLVIDGSTSGAALTVSNSTSTGNILTLNDNATNVLTIEDGGAATFKNSADSGGAFRVQNAAGITLFVVDTQNNQIGTSGTTGASTNSQNLIIRTGSASGTTSNTGDILLRSGSATDGNSGNVSIEVGSASGTGWGNINIGSAYRASSINLGPVGSTSITATVNILTSTGTGTRTLNIGSDAMGAINVQGSTTVISGLSSGSASAFTVTNSTSTGNIAVFSDNTTNILTLANGGGATFRNQTDSTTGFKIQDADGGTSIFNIDTTNERVGIGTDTPQESLDVAGNIRIGARSDNTGSSTYTGLSFPSGEDAISSSAVYNGKLYIGSKDTDSAAIYRFDGGTTWTRVSYSTEGNIISTDGTDIDEVSSLVVFDGYLFASVETGNNTGAVYRYDGSTWTLVNTTRGTLESTANIDGVASLVVVGGVLYAGTTETNGAEVYKYLGGTGASVFARLINSDQTGLSSADPSGDVIDSINLIDYGNRLFVGLETGSDGAARLYWFGGSDFFKNNTTAGQFTSSITGVDDITAMAVYNGSLYIGTGDSTADSAYILKFNGSQMSGQHTTAVFDRVSDATTGKIDSGGTDAVDKIGALRVYNGELYASSVTSTAGTANAGAVFRYSELERTWTRIAEAEGTFATVANKDDVVALIEYNDTLYVGAGDAGGAEMYNYSRNVDMSYALKFVSHSDGTFDNIGTFEFVGVQNADSNSSSSGQFLLSHSIATSAGAYDIAEDYYTREAELNKGDVVAIDPEETIAGFVRRADLGKGDNTRLLGIVSTNPALRLSQKQTTNAEEGYRTVPIALAGRVPVKIDPDSESITAGDMLTASDKVGFAKKLTGDGVVIAKALEGWNVESGKQTAEVYITNGYFGNGILHTESGENTQAEQDQNAVIEGLSWFKDTFFAVADNTLHVLKNIVFFGRAIFKSDVEFEDRVTYHDKDYAGQAKIKAGQTEIRVQFEKPYQETPVVNITPYNYGKFVVTNRDSQGFTIVIESPQVEDVEFGWMAIPIKDAKTYETVSNNN